MKKLTAWVRTAIQRWVDVRIDLIVDILSELPLSGTYYGREIIDRSKGKLSRWTIYSLLSELERNGIVTSSLEVLPERSPPGLIPRRKYALSDFGMEIAFMRKGTTHRKVGQA
jgi:DNA-binding PadR family transcriptional regulator